MSFLNNDYVKTQPTPSDHLHLFVQTTSNVNDVNVKSPTKTHTDHYNGDLKITASILLLRFNIFSRIHFYSADVMNC